MPLQSGDRLGSYTIVAPLGAGGMGEVYRASDTKLKRDVAIKVLPASLARDAERLARFEREAQVLAALNHPNIAQIYGIEESGGTQALVMELVEGRTLDQAILPGGVSGALFFDVAMALADALHAAYQKRVTHRDLKPANIMLTTDGRVKVLDFGLARMTESEPADFENAATQMGLTQAGAVLGTVPYMSPEQVEARPLDHRTDLFSFGVLLYEMATGKRPFQGDTSPALMASILREHPKPVSQTRADLPADISAIIGRCLEKDPRNRIQTAQEILVELKVQRRLYDSGSRKESGIRIPGSSSMKIAVAPFTSRTGSKEVEELADGLTDDVTAGLSRFKYLTVAREQQNARYVLEGSLRASGASVRISARLLDSETGSHLWAENYDRTPGGSSVFETQDDISSRIVAAVADQNGALVRFMGMSLRDRPVEELTVSELVLRFFAFIQNFRPDEHQRLLAGFEKALAREPMHALGWACLAGCYCHGYSYSPNVAPDALERGRQAADRAIEIDPLCQDGWRQLAFLHSYNRDLAAVRMAAEKTISLNPLNTASVAAAGLILTNAGDWERGLEVARQAMAPNPNHAGWYHYAFAVDHYRRGQYEEALAVLKRMNMPEWPRAAFDVAATAGQLERAGEARAALDAVAKGNLKLVEPEAARRMLAIWHWDEGLVEHYMEGFLKAKALADPVIGSVIASSSKLDKVLSDMNRSMAIAVAPFTAPGDDREASALASGLSDDIPAGFSRFSFLTVSREVQGARYVVEGSVRKAGTTIRVSVRLADADTGAHMWAETYTRDTQSTDIFALQDDIAGRIVATVADPSGVLGRAMGMPLRQRPIEELTIPELILRYHLFLMQLQVEEHALLRRAFENALKREPSHAEGWAVLSVLYGHETLSVVNRLPDALGRQRAAAERSVQVDPTCQRGWTALAMLAFAERDLPGLRAAAERADSLNPLNTASLATSGMFLAYAGDWEEGVARVRRAMDLNPHHPGFYHWPSFYNAYRQHAYEEALQIAKRFNMPAMSLSHICMASAAGQLGRRGEARAAFDALAKLGSVLLEPEKARASFAQWQWDEQLLDDLMNGFAKAKALAEGESSKAPASGTYTSIAVLPFADLSEAKDQEWFCDGIAEEILNALTHVKGLSVAARTSAFSFRGKGEDLRAIGEKLHVTTVLEGSVRRAGDRLRINVQLNDVANGYRLWSERYDRSLADIFDVQDEIAKAVAEKLRVTLAGGAEARLVPRATTNMEAYQLYLKGRALLYQRGKSIQPAFESFRKAAELDPGYAPAWAGVADAYTVLAYFGLVRGREAKLQAMTAARKAIELDPNSAEAHSALACAALLHEGDRRTAEREFVRARELNPNYIQGRAWYALFFLQWTWGKFDEGLAEARATLAGDPLSAYAMTIVSFSLTTMRRGDEAAQYARSAIEADPESFLAHWSLALALSVGRRFEEAVAVFATVAAISARNAMVLGGWAMALHRWGRQAEARALYQELLERRSREYITPFNLALNAWAAGEEEQAMNLVEQGWEEREAGLFLFGRTYFDYAEMRRHPRFQEILRKMDAL